MVSSQVAAPCPMIRAAQAAVLASTQLPAATLTVLQRSAAGREVAGSMRWCTGTSPRVHLRTVVLEVASPPDLMATHGPGLSVAAD
jgi:hypothetical protein